MSDSPLLVLDNFAALVFLLFTTTTMVILSPSHGIDILLTAHWTKAGQGCCGFYHSFGLSVDLQNTLYWHVVSPFPLPFQNVSEVTL